jgi:hypothetical protein
MAMLDNPTVVCVYIYIYGKFFLLSRSSYSLSIIRLNRNGLAAA